MKAISLFAVAALAAGVGVANADEPMVLSAKNMDGVTAGSILCCQQPTYQYVVTKKIDDTVTLEKTDTLVIDKSVTVTVDPSITGNVSHATSQSTATGGATYTEAAQITDAKAPSTNLVSFGGNLYQMKNGDGTSVSYAQGLSIAQP